MATILECLNQLPDDMMMLNLADLSPKPTPVSELKQKLAHDMDNNYEVREEPYAYGAKKRKAIGVSRGMTILRQVV